MKRHKDLIYPAFIPAKVDGEMGLNNKVEKEFDGVNYPIVLKSQG